MGDQGGGEEAVVVGGRRRCPGRASGCARAARHLLFVRAIIPLPRWKCKERQARLCHATQLVAAMAASAGCWHACQTTAWRGYSKPSRGAPRADRT
jgi:hypothetical protein